jgi:pimeloyl-ACP methyl ester carboxylesterase
MSRAVLESVSLGRLPCLAMGSGPPLLYLAGLSPVAGVAPNGSRHMERGAIEAFANAGRRVLYVNRRRGLPRGMTMAELAAEHAEGIRAVFGEPVDVLGLSTGGSIAQQLAADHPGVVRRLALVSTGCRLDGPGRRMQRQVAARIRAGAERRALAVFAAGLVPPRRGQLAAAAVAAILGPGRLSGGADDLGDLATTIEAEDAFDLAGLAPIRAPTLIVGGADDRFYPPEIFRATAAMVPGSRLEIVPGRGHITVLWSPAYREEVPRFLDGGLR